MLRRLVIALAIAFLMFSNVLQSLIAVHSSLLMLSWLLTVRPLDTHNKNYLEMVNEFLILILGYFGFLFTDYVGDPVTRYSFGYLYISLLAFTLFLNICNLGFTSVHDLIKHWKYYRQELKRLTSRKKKTEARAAAKAEETAKPKVVKKSVFLRLMEGEQLPQFNQSSEQSSYSSSFEQSSYSQSDSREISASRSE